MGCSPKCVLGHNESCRGGPRVAPGRLSANDGAAGGAVPSSSVDVAVRWVLEHSFLSPPPEGGQRVKRKFDGSGLESSKV